MGKKLSLSLLVRVYNHMYAQIYWIETRKNLQMFLYYKYQTSDPHYFYFRVVMTCAQIRSACVKCMELPPIAWISLSIISYPYLVSVFSLFFLRSYYKNPWFLQLTIGQTMSQTNNKNSGVRLLVKNVLGLRQPMTANRNHYLIMIFYLGPSIIL